MHAVEQLPAVSVVVLDPALLPVEPGGVHQVDVGADLLENVHGPVVRVGPGRAASLPAGRFPGPLSRTGRACSHASGSPRAHAVWLCNTLVVCSRPRRSDVRAPIAIPDDPDRRRIEQHHLAVRRTPPWQVVPAEPRPTGTGMLVA